MVELEKDCISADKITLQYLCRVSLILLKRGYNDRII